MLTHRRHFSLIEVLIAIGIITGIMAVSYGFMRQGLEVRRYSRTLSRRQRLEHNLLQMLSKDIESSQWIQNAPRDIISFRPDSTHPTSSRLELVANTRNYDSESKTATYLNRVSYAVDLMEDGENYALFRRKKSIHQKQSQDAKWEYIYGPLANFTITAWDAKKEEWVDTFSSNAAKKLPAVVEIIIEFPPEDGEIEGDIIRRKIPTYDRSIFKKATVEEGFSPDGAAPERNILPGE